MIGETEYWGKGASKEAIVLVAGFAFECLGLRRLTAGTYSLNHGMNFTFKQLRFELEGKLRKAHFTSPGKFMGGFRWAVLAEDWKALDRDHA